MGRFVDKSVKDWGNYVYAKTNAPEILKEDLKKLKNHGKGKSIFLSSVTDPYQGLEAKYQLTRQCLQVLSDYDFAGQVSILTKSQLVLRDVDIFKKLKNVEIGFTITTTNDKISRYFEKKAPNVSQRLDTMRHLNESGFKTYAFVGPLLPHFVAEPEILDNLLEEIASTGTKELYVEHINLGPYILERFRSEMSDLPDDIMKSFYSSKNSGYREELSGLVLSLVKKYNLHLRLGSAIYHKDL